MTDRSILGPAVTARSAPTRPGSRQKGSSGLARLATAAVLGGALVAAGPASAGASAGGGEAVTLLWARGAGAEGCPDAAQAERAVAARVRRSPFSPTAPRSLHVMMRREDGEWTSVIEERADGALVGIRRIPSGAGDCGSLFSATVLVLSLLVDAGAALGPAPEESAAPAAPAPQAPSPERAAPAAPIAAVGPEAPLPSPETAARWPRAGLHPRAGVVFGVLPRPGPGIALATGTEGRLFEGSAGMWWVPEVRTADERFAFGLTAGWLGGCVQPLRAARMTAGLCGAGMGGAIHAVVIDTYEPIQPGARAWAALSLSARLRVAIAGPLAAEAGAELVVPVTRYLFRVAGGPEVFTQPAAGAFLFAGLGVALP